MHRVELKAFLGESGSEGSGVPNAPCGVERVVGWTLEGFAWLFLMHRVELKERTCSVFLGALLGVPNAPCGVESGMDVLLVTQTPRSS